MSDPEPPLGEPWDDALADLMGMVMAARAGDYPGLKAIWDNCDQVGVVANAAKILCVSRPPGGSRRLLQRGPAACSP